MGRAARQHAFRYLLGWLLLLAWPAAMVTGFVLEYKQCGWRPSLWEDVACKSPHKARGLIYLGQEYYAHGRSDLAELYWARALEASRDGRYSLDGEWGVIAETNLAVLMTDRGQWKEADTVLRGVLHRAPNYWGAWNVMALVMVAGGNPYRAMQITDKILEADPRSRFNASVFYHRGLAYHAMGRCPEANQAYATAIDLDPALKDVPMCTTVH